MDNEITFFGPLNLFWVTGWLAVLMITYLIKRPHYQSWAWVLVTSRLGNPSIIAAPGPSMLGDILHYQNYPHFLADIQDQDILGAKILYVIFIENLIFMRVCSIIMFLRNICFLFIYVSVLINSTRNDFSIFNDIIVHETAIGIPDSEALTALLTMIDLIKTIFIIFNPDVLMPSNMGQAILINITWLAKLQLI